MSCFVGEEYVNMHRRTIFIWLVIPVLVSCIDTFDPPQAVDCEHPLAYYPDDDGDGIGEPDEMYIGCAPPKGWVSTLSPPQDTGSPQDTGLDSGLGSGN